MLGKRPRSPINVDLNDVEMLESSEYPPSQIVINGQTVRSTSAMVYNRTIAGGSGLVETAHFLKTCGLCNRRLTPGRDIYMYRGDTAFCSQECREQQMNYDERKEKCSLAVASKKDESHHPARTTTPFEA